MIWIFFAILGDAIFSRDSDLTTTNVIQGCGYVNFRVWLCAKRCGYVSSNKRWCGYVQKGVVMYHQIAIIPRVKMVWQVWLL